jgi:hypothetical protein
MTDEQPGTPKFYRKPQFYETTIYDEESGLSAHLFSVPQRCFPEGFVRPIRDENVELKRYRLDWQKRALIGRFDYFKEITNPNADQPLKGLDPRKALRDVIHESRSLREVNYGHAMEFVNYLSYESIVPFESSPLSSISLENLVRASGSAIGAYAGFIVGKDTMLLLISVPLGMVICGIASGLSHGLEESIRQRIGDYLGFVPKLPRNESTSAGASERSSSAPESKAKSKPRSRKGSNIKDQTEKNDPAPDDEPDPAA